MGYQGVQMVSANPAYLEGRSALETSEALEEVLGSPITVSEPTNIQTNPGENRIGMTYEVTISGPKGSGTAEIEVDGQPFTDDWNLESLKAEVDGQEIEIEGGGLDIKIEGEDMGKVSVEGFNISFDTDDGVKVDGKATN